VSKKSLNWPNLIFDSLFLFLPFFRDFFFSKNESIFSKNFWYEENQNSLNLIVIIQCYKFTIYIKYIYAKCIYIYIFICIRVRCTFCRPPGRRRISTSDRFYRPAPLPPYRRQSKSRGFQQNALRSGRLAHSWPSCCLDSASHSQRTGGRSCG